MITTKAWQYLHQFSTSSKRCFTCNSLLKRNRKETPAACMTAETKKKTAPHQSRPVSPSEMTHYKLQLSATSTVETKLATALEVSKKVDRQQQKTQHPEYRRHFHVHQTQNTGKTHLKTNAIDTIIIKVYIFAMPPRMRPITHKIDGSTQLSKLLCQHSPNQPPCHMTNAQICIYIYIYIHRHTSSIQYILIFTCASSNVK